MTIPGSQYMSDFFNTMSEYTHHYSSILDESYQTGTIWYIPPALIGGYLAYSGSIQVGHALIGQEWASTRLKRLEKAFTKEPLPFSKRASEFTQAFIGPASLRNRTYIAAKGALKLAAAAAIIYPFFVKDKKLEAQFEMDLGDLRKPESSSTFIHATVSGDLQGQTLKSAKQYFTENENRQAYLFQRGLQTPNLNHKVVDAAEQILNSQSKSPIQDALFKACQTALGSSDSESCSSLKSSSQEALFTQGPERTFANLDAIDQACNSTLQHIQQMPKDADLQKADTAKLLCDYTMGWINPKKCDQLHDWISPNKGNGTQNELTDFVTNYVCEPLQKRAELDLKLQQLDPIFSALDAVSGQEQAANKILELSQLYGKSINPLKQFSESDPERFVELSCRFLGCDSSESISTKKMIQKAIKNILQKNHPDRPNASPVMFNAAETLKSIFDDEKSLYELAPTSKDGNQTLSNYYSFQELWSKISDRFKMPEKIAVEGTEVPEWTLNEDSELPPEWGLDDNAE